MNAREPRGRLGRDHRPRPAAGGAAARAPRASARNWIWRCHIDLSTPNPATIARLLPLIERLRRDASGTCRSTCPHGLDGDGVQIWPPAIDPLSPKNMALSPEDAAFVCEPVRDRRRPAADLPGLALRPVEGPDRRDRRLPAWSREEVPEVQLALVGSMATDDPEGWDFFHHTVAHADGDPDIKILNNLNNVGAIEVNAFQSQSDVVHAEVDPRGLRADRHRGALEGAADDRRQRRRHPAADRRRRDRLPRRLRRGVRRSAALEILDDPELGKRLGRRGQGARPRALPHAAPAARLARAARPSSTT